VGVGDGIGSCVETLGGSAWLPLPVGKEASPIEPNRNNAITRIPILLFIVLSSVRARLLANRTGYFKYFFRLRNLSLHFAPLLLVYLHRFFP
jgi:hypothetical protein